MSRVDVSKITKYLSEYPGDVVCARQMWYEGLDGHGTANPTEIQEMESALDAAAGWECIGDYRYEKYGNQRSWKKAKR